MENTIIYKGIAINVVIENRLYRFNIKERNFQTNKIQHAKQVITQNLK
jgi:hypothetical protein